MLYLREFVIIQTRTAQALIVPSEGQRMNEVQLRPRIGGESQGLNAVREALPPSCLLRLPMQATSRSLNLSNTVAVVLYEALRQNIDVEALVL